MKYKKGLLFICLIICLFSIASVVASDDNETVVASDDQNDELIEIENQKDVLSSNENETIMVSENQNDELKSNYINEESNIGVTEENELTATTGTFTDLANDIANAGDELNLTKDYVYSSGDPIYKQGIIINKKITINGNGFTINGNKQSMIFQINSKNVILKNISFVNCSVTSTSSLIYAGAIIWNGDNGVLNDCSFINCHSSSSTSYGGAIYWNANKGIINGCSFINCSSSSTTVSYGGAIRCGGCTLVNCDFVNCSSSYYGGAVYCENSCFMNCTFDNCHSRYGGSAIGSYYGNNLIFESNFINCSSLDGSAIHSSLSRNFTIRNSNFTNCVGIDGVNDICGSKFNNCRSISVINNLSNSNFVDSVSIILKGDNFTVSNCSFLNHLYSTYNSNSIFYANGNNGVLFNCSFVNSSTYYSLSYRGFGGAAVWWRGANGTLFNCSFVNCSSLSPSLSTDICGGAVYWGGINGTLYESEFINCTSIKGGAIYLSSNCSIYNCYFKGNKAYVADSVYIKNNLIQKEIIIINNHIFDENPFRNDIYQLFENLEDGYFVNIDKNYKAIFDSTIYISKNNIFVEGNGHIINSIGSNYKFFKITGKNVTIQNIIFVNFNTTSKYSSQYGGVIEWIGNNGQLSNCTFINCSFLSEYHVTYSNGGAIYCTGANNTLMNCNFINCSSEYYGGAIYCEGDNNTLINCNFSNCISKYGGAAIKWQGSYGILKDCSFDNCLLKSSTTSGVINWIGINGSLFNCSFSNISQTNIYWGGENGTIYKCSFTNCSSSTRGSAIYWNGNNGILTDCRFLNSNESCVVYWYGIHGLLNNCSFINCSSRTNGGAIYWWGKNGVLNNSIFTNCSSSKYGGSVCWDADYGILSNCTFINSSANESGGAIYWKHSNGVVINCIFINCSSINKGKFIYWTQKNGTLYNCSFDGDKYNYGLYCYAYYYKFDSKLNVSVNDTKINEASIIHISVYPVVNNVTITIYNLTDGKKQIRQFNLHIFDETTLYLDNLTYGDYSCTVQCYEDDLYGSKSITKNFKVTKLTPTINSSEIINKIAGDNIIYNITLNNDANGTIQIFIFNQTFNGTVVNGFSAINITNLVGGEYNYTVEYSGDSNYGYLVLTKSAMVDYKNSSIDFEIKESIKFDEYVVIRPIVTPDATGTINIFINNMFNKTINVNEAFTLGNLNVGNYSITLVYKGDKYYNISKKTKLFNITPINTNISVLYDSLIARNTIINVTLDSRATGNITININNKHYIQSLDNGKTSFRIDELVSDGYNYIISYSGDKNFNKNSTTGYFFIQLKESKINVSAENIIVGDIAKINYNITEGVTGNISVYIDNKFFNNFSIGEQIELVNLTSGKYTINISYHSDGFYDSCNDSINLTVFKKASVKLNVNEINFNEPFELCPIVTSGTTGNLDIYVDNIYKSSINIGKAYRITNLNGGNHTIRVVYSGDDYFAPCENTTILKVNKINTTILVSHAETIAGNTVLTITLNNKATGLVTVNVNNKNYPKSLSNGKTNVYIYDLPFGDYNYTVFYSGDQNFNNNTLTKDIFIQPKESKISIMADDIYVDDIAKINYALTSGAYGVLSVYVNDTFVKNVTVGNNIELENLAYGNYKVKVVYNSDGYYATCQNITTFKVKKLNPTLTLSANNISSTNYNYFNTHITAGNDVNLIFIFNEDATGEVNITHESGVGHEANYTLELNNGKANITIPNVMADSHYFTISYSGDDKYLPFNGESEVYFNYKQSSINYTIPSNILWGDSFIINPVLPDDATGEIEITIYDNKGYYFNDFITAGSLYNFTILNGDTNYLKLYYSGDEYYGDYNYLREFNVAKLNTALSITDKMEVNNLVPIKVTLNEDATGNIRIYMGDKWNYGKLNNGECIFNVSDLIGTVYNVNIVYDGDSKYNSINVFKSVNITRKKLNHTFNIHNIIYGEDMNLIHTSSASTIVDFYIDGVYKQSVNAGFTYTIEKPSIGEHELRVVFNGNNYYEPYDDTTKFWVFQKYPIDSQDTYILYNSGNYFKARFYDEYGSPLVNEYVGFSVNGKDEARQTDNGGWAIFDIDLKPGVYNVTSINLQFNEKTVNKLTVFTSIESQDLIRAYNSGIDFNATFLNKNAKALANTPVIFKVNDEDYFVTTNMDGQAVLNVPLNIGTYTIITINTATKENKTNTLTIVPSVQANDMIRTYNSTMDYNATFLDVDGKYLINHLVSFKIGETTYESTTDNKGVAALNVPLSVGEYNITAINPITDEKSTKKLTILPRIIENSDMITDTDCEDYFVVRIIGDDGSVVGSGQTVTFTFNNTVSNVKTDAQGYAKLLIPSLNKGKYPISVTYKGFTASNNIFVYKNLESIITIDVKDIDYNQNLKLNVSVIPEYRYGNLTIGITGANGFNVEYNTTANKLFTKELTGLNVSDYVVAVRFIDRDNYFISQDVAVFEVSKIDPNVIVVVYGAEYYQNATITVNIPQASGNVTIKIGDERTYTEFIPEDGVIVKRINDLNIGEYDVAVTYNGNENYNPLTKTAKMNITKIPSYVWLDSLDMFDYGQVIVVNLTASVDGVVKVEFDEDVQYLNVVANKLYQLKYYDYEAGWYYPVTATLTPSNDIYNASYDEISVGVDSIYTSIEVISDYIEFGQPTNITVIVNSTATGNIRLIWDNQEYVQNLTDGKTVFNIYGFEIGRYSLQVIYDGDNNFIGIDGLANFNVTKIKSYAINIPNSIENNLTIDLPINATGNVTVVINNTDYNATVVNGHATVNLSSLINGNYTYHFVYSGDDRYLRFTTNGILEINRFYINPEIIIPSLNHPLADGSVNVELPIDAKGTMTLIINNTNYSFDVINGTAKVIIPKLNSGDYPYTIIYSGDNKYSSFVEEGNLKIEMRTGTIRAYDMVINYGEEYDFIATFYYYDGSPLANRTIGFYVHNISNVLELVQTDFNGVAKLKIGLKPGEYNITSYNGETDEYAINKLIVKQVMKSIQTENMVVDFGEDYDFIATFFNSNGLPLTNKYIAFKVNDEEYPVKTDSNGVAKLVIGLNPGEYNITSINDYTGESVVNKLTVKAAAPKPINDNQITIPSLSSGSGAVKLPVDASGTITLDIAGIKYDFPVVNGVANIKLSDLPSGSYGYIITYSGDTKYTSFSKTGSVTVNKQTTPTKPVVKTTITLKTVQVKKSAKKLILQATLKQGKTPLKSKKIVFKFNGKKYTAKTNKKGVAKVIIKKSILKKLKVGKKVNYQASYGKIITKKTAKIKK